MKILVVEARFYNDISDLLFNSAVKKIKELGFDFDVITVLGALEIPSAIAFSLNSNYDGFVALGAVIRGETSHYDIVSNESARGIMALSIKEKIAIGNGIITTENKEQAIVRAKVKGAFAVEACARLIEIATHPHLKF
jgi:6,7-dimethyl-8-ribityllumazine synthase